MDLCVLNSSPFTHSHTTPCTLWHADIPMLTHIHTQGRAGLPRYAIITALDGKPTPDLASFAAVLRQQPHAARVPLEYYTFGERHRRKNSILQIDRQWCVCVCEFVCLPIAYLTMKCEGLFLEQAVSLASLCPHCQ